jgi:hypothetical protein
MDQSKSELDLLVLSALLLGSLEIYGPDIGHLSHFWRSLVTAIIV